jgi:class 3 adenylate cyclase/tetratricopeptide (TPR) repeat protein
MSRRLAAILAADVVGYSAQMERDEAGTLARLRACEAEVIEPAVSAHGGRIFKRMGDGYLVEFASVVSAVECAIVWQAGAGEPIGFRIGVHLGDVMVEGDDLFGDGINIASRLEGLADPGGLCLSEDAQRQLRGKLHLSFEDMGERALKNIAAPIRVFRLVGGATEAAAPATSGCWDVPRILLIPFRHRGGDDEAALAGGVTESVAEALSAFEAFSLIDPGLAADIIKSAGSREAGRRLDATYILEGSTQVSGDRVRIRVQLTDVVSGRRVWSESFDRSAGDSFALEDDIAALVGSTLGEAVEAEMARAIEHKPDAELTPFETYVRALEHLHRQNPQDSAVARAMMERLLGDGSEDFRVPLVLCWTYAMEIAYGWPPTRDNRLEYCLDLMGKALRAHDRSPSIHRLMGRLFGLAGDPSKARAHSARARQLNPFDSDIMYSHAFVEARDGRVDEAAALVERALAINPYAPAFYRSGLSLLYFLAGRPADGLDCLGAIEATVGHSRIGRIVNLAALGRSSDAAVEARGLLSQDPSFTIGRYLAGLQFADDEGKAAIAEALRRAGLPE